MVRLLLEGGTEVDYQGYDGKTALIIACSFIQQDDSDPRVVFLVKTLLNHGADPNIQDLYGKTALMHAFRYHSSPEIVKLLLSKGANLEMCDIRGMTSWDYLSDRAYNRYAHCLEGKIRRECEWQDSRPKEIGIPVVVIDYASPKHIAYDREEIYFQFPGLNKHRAINANLNQDRQILIRQHSDGVRKRSVETSTLHKLTIPNKTLSSPDIHAQNSMSKCDCSLSNMALVSAVDRGILERRRFTSLPKLPPISSDK